MKFEDFERILSMIDEQDSRVNQLYKNKIDIMEFVDPYHSVIAMLFKEIYGEQGYDWIGWFVYENDMGRKKLEAYEDDNTLICQDVKGLWEYIEKNHSWKKKNPVGSRIQP
jgi:hypothetical protein